MGPGVPQCARQLQIELRLLVPARMRKRLDSTRRSSIQSKHGIIPAFTLERPPSAELKPAQVDPFDYPTLALKIDRLVQENRSNPALRNSDHKRWQMGVVLKIGQKALGSGRMIPITRR